MDLCKLEVLSFDELWPKRQGVPANVIGITKYTFYEKPTPTNNGIAPNKVGQLS